MKELELRVIQSLVTKEIHASNIRYIIIFVAINLFIALINWLIQSKLKNIESRIYKQKVREDRRIAIIEEIYKELVSFTYILDANEMLGSLPRLSILEKKIAENRLYITSNMNNYLTDYLDYCKTIMSDFRQKSFSKETQLLRKIETEFNK